MAFANAISKVTIIGNGPTSEYENRWISSCVKDYMLIKNPTSIYSVQEIAENEKNCPSGLSSDGSKIDLSEYNGKLNYLRDSSENDILITNNTAILSSQIYTLQYEFTKTVYGNYFNVVITYTFSAVSNRLPLKKWTIADIVDRIFDTEECLRDSIDEKAIPKYYLNEKDREKLKDIIAPEFAFTNMTLREKLKQIGGFIHGEPRIIKVDNPESDQRRFEVGFDYYGGNELSKISKRAYMSSTFRIDVNEYCTALDSSADNLVNQLNWAQGVITEPFYNDVGYSYGRSIRTENISTRLSEDDNSFIPSSSAIYKLGGEMKVICTYFREVNSDGKFIDNFGKWDITPYIFEKTAYNNLSSYDGTYPYCKAYALYYESGQPNIKGLFFKNPNAISPIFENYAIVNILEAVVGRKLNFLTSGLTDANNSAYFDIQFRIEYLPIYSARVKTNKSFVEKGFKSELAYNQGANMIETQFYGENLKGTVARLGNVEKTYTYNLAFLSQIPKVGTKFDEHYYISAVKTELLPTYIKCTVALSKDFNRLSQYVGINSIKRMYEISEVQAQRRNSVYPEYILISENQQSSDTNALFNEPNNVAGTLFNKINVKHPVSSINLRCYNINFNTVGTLVSLPIISSSFGNSMTFSAQFKDNYSAGNKNYFDVFGNYINVYSVPVQYNDNYGRFYYLSFDLLCNNINAKTTSGNSGEQATMRAFPNVETYNGLNIISTNNHYIRYRKDNREIPNITYELTAVTDNEDIVIGSELMRNCALVNALPITDLELRLYKTPIPTIGGLPDGEYITGSYSVSGNTLTLAINNSNASQYVSWALCTKSSVKTIQVEDENGIEGEQSIEMGNKLLLGQNKPLEKISSTEYSRKIYFSVKERIYN